MRGNPLIRLASTHPFHRSWPVTDVPRLGWRQAERRPQQLVVDNAWPPSPSALALEELAAELAKFLGGRQKPGLEGPPACTSQSRSAQVSAPWQDQLLVEIEDLAGELKGKVARYESLRTVHSGTRTGPADGAAIALIHQALEDIAATARGLEGASRELFLRAGMNGDLALKVETSRE